MVAGHRPFTRTDYTTEQASAHKNSYGLHERLYQTTIVQSFCNKVHNFMADLDTAETVAQAQRDSLLRMLELNFQELERGLNNSGSSKLTMI